MAMLDDARIEEIVRRVVERLGAGPERRASAPGPAVPEAAARRPGPTSRAARSASTPTPTPR
jgi:hypothetical protein